jgi:hypothetical protein
MTGLRSTAFPASLTGRSSVFLDLQPLLTDELQTCGFFASHPFLDRSPEFGAESRVRARKFAQAPAYRWSIFVFVFISSEGFER